MKKPIILIVDDEWTMRQMIRVYLKKENADIEEASEGHEALSLIKKNNYNLVILDVMLPGLDGWEICEKIRETDRVTPILMLTARDDIKDKLLGFRTGADDYLTKPFIPEELVARVHALLRRQTLLVDSHNKQQVIQYQEMKINKASREVYINGNRLSLTPKEFDLIVLFASHPKQVYTRDVLLDVIWTGDSFRDVRTVDTHIKNLREKLRDAGLTYNAIKTVWGVGYKFNQPDDDHEVQ